MHLHIIDHVNLYLMIGNVEYCFKFETNYIYVPIKLIICILLYFENFFSINYIKLTSQNHEEDSIIIYYIKYVIT